MKLIGELLPSRLGASTYLLANKVGPSAWESMTVDAEVKGLDCLVNPEPEPEPKPGIDIRSEDAPVAEDDDVDWDGRRGSRCPTN